MPIDLRTDTITLPTMEMRAAMAAAVVGDDFYDEDPTVDALEERAADLLGKEAGLYVPSGTMGNLLAHLTHAPAGGEVIGPEPAHSFMSEGGGPARVAGMMVRPVSQSGARLDVDRYASLIHGASVLSPATALIWVEQPTRGYVVPVSDLEALRRTAEAREVPVHFDGARIFNASVALGVPVAEIAQYADSVMFCVSKGLGAPVGSVLVGTASFIERARRQRQMLGGGMRQAGIIAAGGLFALEHNVERLAEDHANARRLADGIRLLGGISVDRDIVETNIFYAEILGDDLAPQAFADALRGNGVVVNRPGAGRRTIRFVTHIGIDAADIDAAIRIVGATLDVGPSRQAGMEA
jgi:threonine aldolase